MNARSLRRSEPPPAPAPRLPVAVLRCIYLDALEAAAYAAGGHEREALLDALTARAGVQNPSLTRTYLDNLLRLKILHDERTDGGEHPFFEENPFKGSSPMTHRFVAVTEFGRRFLRCVVVEPT